MIKKIIISVLVILIAGAILFFYFPERNMSNDNFDVLLTEEGFQPAELTINRGDTVTFTTALGKPFWPASDLHPSHTIYPEFDPQEPISSSQSWSFRFNKSGAWKYHDHLFSVYRGIIIVKEGGSNSIGYSASDCKNYSNKGQCWEGLIDQALDKAGLNAAFELLASLYNAEPAFASDCHSYTHKIGVAAYEKFSEGEEVELTPKTYYCGYGFYHGFMETLLHQSGKIEEAQEFCKYAGEKLAAETSDAEGACYHGIGHGAVDGGDPTAWGDPQKMIEPGIKICEQVSARPEHLYRCVTGVYNAIEILSMDPKYKLSMIDENPFWLCPSQPDNYKEGCYTNMLPALMRTANRDFEKMVKEIKKIPSAGDKESLVLIGHTVKEMVTLSLFYDFIMLNLKEPDYNIKKGVEICHSLESNLRLACIEGLSGGYMKFGEPENEYVKGLAFCGSELLREDEKGICHKYILARLRIWYSSDKAKMICGGVPQEYKKFCSV